ncbi:PspC domain-containing protein [Propioniciclava soli]|uniref:PspC domain-containing protein n=1 Tax=Propioniciclava soli TaxID=2775081 RepID=UPI001E4D49DF|nr:PspC domain-containing protein [Propioniciclava soli]
MASTSLVRSRSDKVIAGVCGGLSRTLGIDATIVRILFLLAAIFIQPLGWMAYVALWLFLPYEDGDETGFNQLKRQFGSGPSRS